MQVKTTAGYDCRNLQYYGSFFSARSQVQEEQGAWEKKECVKRRWLIYENRSEEGGKKNLNSTKGIPKESKSERKKIPAALRGLFKRESRSEGWLSGALYAEKGAVMIAPRKGWFPLVNWMIVSIETQQKTHETSPRHIEFALLRSVTIAQKTLDYKVWHMTSTALPEAQVLEFSYLQRVGRGALSLTT